MRPGAGRLPQKALLVALACVLCAAPSRLAAGQVVVQVGPGNGPVQIIVDGVEVNSDGTAVTPPDPIAMAVADVVRGHAAILKVLPKLDPAIVPALEEVYLASLKVDEDEALLLVSRLGDDRYAVREQATQTLIEVQAEIEPALQGFRDQARDPEVQMRLERILFDRRRKNPNESSLVGQALKIVYDHWFDTLLTERSARVLNDPQDDPAALFFALAPAERLATAIAARPVLEQARLWLCQVRLLTADPRALRALAQIEPAVLKQAARESWWPLELATEPEAGETILYQRAEGNSLVNALFIESADKTLYAVAQSFCIFQIPFGPGNPEARTGAILRGRYQYKLEDGRMQPFTTRRLIPGVPPGMLLPRIGFVEGMDEDWNATVTRIPLWSKPYVPEIALKPTMRFVLNAKHTLPEPNMADRQLTPGVSAARIAKLSAEWAAEPATARAANDDPAPAAAWMALNNAPAEQLPAVLAKIGAGGWRELAGGVADIAQTDRDGGGAAALEALFHLAPAQAGELALRLARVRWQENRAQYALAFLKRHFAATAQERGWEFEQRFEAPAGLAARAAKGQGQAAQ